MKLVKRSNKMGQGRFGIYSPFISEQDASDLEQMKTNGEENELAYARTRLKAAQQAMLEAADDDLALKWDKACRGWLQIILGTIDRLASRSKAASIFQSLFDALRAANDKDGLI
jgi:hypothetical protein